MEILLPFLFAAVVFGFTVYSNFQKEQEKARKRNLEQRPRPDETVVERGASESQRFPPKKTVLGRTLSEDKDSHTVREPTHTRRSPVERRSKTETKQLDPYLAYTGKLEEVGSVKRRKSDRNVPLVQILDENTTEINETAYSHFDLRTAVIQSAILNRPYKD